MYLTSSGFVLFCILPSVEVINAQCEIFVDINLCADYIITGKLMGAWYVDV